MTYRISRNKSRKLFAKIKKTGYSNKWILLMSRINGWVSKCLRMVLNRSHLKEVMTKDGRILFRDFWYPPRLSSEQTNRSCSERGWWVYSQTTSSDRFRQIDYGTECCTEKSDSMIGDKRSADSVGTCEAMCFAESGCSFFSHSAFMISKSIS